MNGLEVVGIILAFGLVILVDVVMILGAVSKMIDIKMKTKSELELKTFEKEMEIMGKSIDKFAGVFMEAFGGMSKKGEDI